ncbi:MAG: PEP-CTERM sorting domain-containing protein [Planctomycetota bacterium]
MSSFDGAMAENRISAEDRGLTQRLSQYAIVVGATSVASGAAGLEVYLEDLGIDVNQFGAQTIDFLLDGDFDLTLKNYVFPLGNYQGATIEYAGGELVGFRDNGIRYASVLSEGDPINASTVGDGQDPPIFAGSMAYGSTNPNAQWNDVTGGYLGLSFPDEAGTVTFYAWVRMDINNTNGTMFIDAAFASDDPAGIVAGQIGTTGDYDGSGSVEQGDLNLVLNNWGRNVDPIADGGNGVPNGWVNNLPLGTVDQEELNLVLNNWGSTSTQPVVPAFAVPEPGTLGLLAAGAIGLAAKRRRV